MKRRVRPALVVAVATVLTLAFGLTSCVVKDEPLDLSGKTLAEVEQLSLKAQFENYGERYLRVQELLANAQHQVSDGVWGWGGEAIVPTAGSTSSNQLSGATSENSYYLQASRSIVLPGAVGAEEDTVEISSYLEAEGLEPVTSELDGDRFRVSARTDDGMWIEFTVQPNGQYNVGVHSELFWGDTKGLLREIADRIPESIVLTESDPDTFIPFPSWDTPPIYAPE